MNEFKKLPDSKTSTENNSIVFKIFNDVDGMKDTAKVNNFLIDWIYLIIKLI